MRALVLLLILLLVPQTFVRADFATGSLYEIPFSWKDEYGEEFKLGSLKGAPVILTMAYTRCKTACPFTMQRIKRVAAALKESSIPAQFVIVSLDPENDTPETLLTFKKTYELETKSWHLLTGADNNVRKLSVLTGYSYQQNSNDPDIVHSNKILVLDKSGRIINEIEGLGSDLEPFINNIKSLR